MNEGSSARACGDCTLCCELLRVDEIGKLAGAKCIHQQERGGCAIHASRPSVCRGYRCLWLGGALEEVDRPDRLGAVLDLVHPGPTPTLRVREAVPGNFDASPRLRAIAERYRVSMPVRITDARDPLDADASFRVLLPDGEEQLVSGDLVLRKRNGRVVGEDRLPWLERLVRRASLAWQRVRLRRFAARAEAFRRRSATRD